MTEKCNRPGCDGIVDDTGFCQTCFRRPLPVPSPVRVDPPESLRSMWLVPDLLSVQVPEPPDPSEQVLPNPQVPEPSRFCGHCHSSVGRSYKGAPPVLEGNCPKCQTPFAFVPKLKAGDLVAGQYEVVGCVAKGGLGWVYLAMDTHLDGNYVALKGLITNDETALRMAVAERRFLTSIDHPNIVRIFNSVTHRDARTGEETGYIVMEFLTGPSLEDIRTAAAHRDPPLPLEHLLGFGHEILAAIEYLHERDMLYCDMKPSNVIRSPDRVKVIDIGGVRRVDDLTSPLVYTENFLHETERKQRVLTVRSDIHTVGRTLEEMLTVSRPEDGAGPDSGDVSFAVESLRKLIGRATAAYDDRFATAAEMNRQLKGVLRELLSLRTGRPHPEPSQVFAPPAVLLDGGLGSIPGLGLWTRRPEEQLDIRCPAPLAVVVALAEPLLDPLDPGLDLLETTTADNPRDLIDKLSAVRLTTEGAAREAGKPEPVEIHFALCRAHLAVAAQDPAAADTYEPAAQHLEAAVRALKDRAAHDWRVQWHRGLCALALGDVPTAREAFDRVSDACPGEIAPKMALGYCSEYLDRRAEAGRYYQAVWRRDRSEGSAAFGLARIALEAGDRARAVEILDETPRVSRHYEPARTAAVRVLSGRLPSGGPSAADLAEAERRLADLRLDGGAATGESRDRLTAIVAEARLRHAEGHEHQATTGLRTRLERSYRALAAQARTRDEHGVLVDLANRVRERSRW